MLHVQPADKETIIDTVRHIIKQQKKNINYDFSAEQKKIDQIVNKYFSGAISA
jgi:iron uptake system EfeUOB component EfeO/EfeM